MVLQSAIFAESPFEPFEPRAPSPYKIDTVVKVTINLGQETAGYVDGIGLVIIKPKQVQLDLAGARRLLGELKEIKKDRTLDPFFPIDPVGSPYMCWVNVMDMENEIIDGFPVYTHSKERTPILHHFVVKYEPDLEESYKERLKKFMAPIEQE